MDYNINAVDEKQLYAAKYARYALILGVISLCGMCCFPLMPIVGGMGIIFALISRGGSREFARDAKNGLILSGIGSFISIVLTIGIIGFSTYTTINEIKRDPGIIDDVEEQYEQIFDSSGQEMPEQLREAFDEMRRMAEELNETGNP